MSPSIKMIKLRHLLLKSLSSAMSGQTIIWQQPLGAYMPASVTSAVSNQVSRGEFASCI